MEYDILSVKEGNGYYHQGGLHRGPLTTRIRDLRGVKLLPAYTDLAGGSHYYIMGRPLDWRVGPAAACRGAIAYVNKAKRFHRGADLPAVFIGGDKMWFKHGLAHRDGDEPSVICADGEVQYQKYGKYHRDNNKPAIIRADGSVEWWRRGVRYYPFDAALDEEPKCT